MVPPAPMEPPVTVACSCAVSVARMAFWLLMSLVRACLRLSRCLSSSAIAVSVRLAICCAPSSWRATVRKWVTSADRSLESCSRTEAWDSTACGLSEVSRAPIDVRLPLSYAVVAIWAISARMLWKLARSTLTS